MRILTSMFLILIMFSVFFTGITGCSSAVSGALEVGKPAPDFNYPDAQGKTVSLSDLSGKVVVINFWATWCGPCRQEMPLIDALANNDDNEALGIVLLSVNAGESRDAVNSYMATNGYTFDVILDGNNAISSKYNIRYIPTTIFVGRDGVIRSIKTGAFLDQAELVKFLDDAME
jgi:cytochrome c biogenesis protein CcmG/thiol:disulfide interchange protein DsbE